MPKKTEILERAGGWGKLFRDGTVVAEPVYVLTVSQEVFVERSPGGTTEKVEGLRDIEVNLRLSRDEALRLMGAELVLHLDDGRRLPIFVSDPGGTIAARGWFERAAR
jgi:hypothetical protein